MNSIFNRLNAINVFKGKVKLSPSRAIWGCSSPISRPANHATVKAARAWTQGQDIAWCACLPPKHPSAKTQKATLVRSPLTTLGQEMRWVGLFYSSQISMENFLNKMQAYSGLLKITRKFTSGDNCIADQLQRQSLQCSWISV